MSNGADETRRQGCRRYNGAGATNGCGESEQLEVHLMGSVWVSERVAIRAGATICG
jgi:hypothetical protein